MCLSSSHSGYLLDHPCLIWVLELACVLFYSWCPNIYGALVVGCWILQCYPCLAIRSSQSSRLVASMPCVLENTLLVVLQGTQFSESLVVCMITQKTPFFVLVLLRESEGTKACNFLGLMMNTIFLSKFVLAIKTKMLDFKNCPFASGNKNQDMQR